MNTIRLNNFDGHLVLYCKNHYRTEDFFEGLKMIWAIRCGWDYSKGNDDQIFEYIADQMFDILYQYGNTTGYLDIKTVMRDIHRELRSNLGNKPKNMSPIQSLIWEYRSVIYGLQIKDKNSVLVDLPKPKKRVFNRILRGNGHYSDYYLIK